VDLGTILGVIGGFSLIIIAMAQGGGIGWFLDGPSALIVLGGTIGATLVNYPLKDVLGVISVAKNVFRKMEHDPAKLIALFVQMSKIARRDGILSLQQVAERAADPFSLKRSISSSIRLTLTSLLISFRRRSIPWRSATVRGLTFLPQWAIFRLPWGFSVPSLVSFRCCER